MTEATLDLQPSWPFYQSHEQVYCLHSSARSAQFQEKQLYTYLATLGATSSVAEFDKVCTQFEEKSQLYTYLGSTGHLYCLHRLQSAKKFVHNSRKTQVYTYKACESTPSRFHVL